MTKNSSPAELQAAAGAAHAGRGRQRRPKGGGRPASAKKRNVRPAKAAKGGGKGALGAGTKQEQLIAMLRRPEGTSVDEVAKTLGWQAHTVRGAISGALKKKLGLVVDTEKVEGRGRVYRIAD